MRQTKSNLTDTLQLGFEHWEKVWEKRWEKDNLYQAKDFGQEKKEYVLVEFPYPSGSGLHVGHAFTMTGADVYARKSRMTGKNVLFPMGWDAFGLPTENYAISTGQRPQDVTKKNTDTFRRQMKKMAFSFDWPREINTTDPNYYRWTQWIFIQLFKRGLAYKQAMPINWCPNCKIGLANEEVIDGRCERCGAQVFRRKLNQWIVKITDYADRLIEGLEKTDFVEKVKLAQVNWIGKSEGAKIKFKVQSSKFKVDGPSPSSHSEGTPEESGNSSRTGSFANAQDDGEKTAQDDGEKTAQDDRGGETWNNVGEIEVFTTRPDTLWGATFMVVSPEHPLTASLLKSKVQSPKSKIEEIKEYVEEARKKSELERTDLAKDKSGVFTGLYALNPANKKKIPIWISDFVLESYGTGAIMAVPAHDERDWQFAKKFSLPIIPVVEPEEGWDFDQGAYTRVDQGKMANSDFINGLVPDEAIKRTINWLEEKGIGQRATGYHLRDWIFSRQHYWGEPIPMVYCEKCAKKGITWWDTPGGKNFIKNSKLKTQNFNDQNPKQKSFENLNLGNSDLIRNSKLEIRNYSSPSGELAGWFPVPEEELPVKLPKVENYQPTDTGESPLAAMKDWVATRCPCCGSKARRETDTMPNWAGSDWYYLAYCFANRLKNSKLKTQNSNKTQNFNDQNPKQKSFENLNLGNSDLIRNSKLEIRNSQDIFSASKNILSYWLPVDLYIGGDEHNTLHLLYSRFIYQFLHDLGVVPKQYSEPYYRRISHGVILGADEQRMSKSRGNVINPDDKWKKYGVDTLRMYLMFMGPFEATMVWNENALRGTERFLIRFKNLVEIQANNDNKVNRKTKQLIHHLTAKVSKDIDSFAYNTAIAAMMETLNAINNDKLVLTREDLGVLVKLLAPFAPYLAEELWCRVLKNDFSVHQQSWPKVQKEYLKAEKNTIIVQVNGRLKGKIDVKRYISMDKDRLILLIKETPAIKKHLLDKKVKKVIFIPGKLINFVI